MADFPDNERHLSVETARPIQEVMINEARSGFVQSELEQLRALIRIVVEVSDDLSRKPVTEYDDPGYRYTLETIISGIEAFDSTARAYRVLVGARPSLLKWDVISKSGVLDEIAKMFALFMQEKVFAIRCRILLDLYKLQLVLLAMTFP